MEEAIKEHNVTYKNNESYIKYKKEKIIKYGKFRCNK